MTDLLAMKISELSKKVAELERRPYVKYDPSGHPLFFDAKMICHYDGAEPFERDFTGNANGHKGQVGQVTGGAHFRPGKFGKGVVVAESGINYCGNPSAEIDTSWWTTVDPEWTRTTEDSFVGSACYKNNGDYNWSDLQPPTSPATINQDWTVSYWYKVDGKGEWTKKTFSIKTQSSGVSWIRLAFYTSSNKFLRCKIYTDAGTILEGGTESGTTYVSYILLDGILFEQKAYSTPYFDGSMQGCSWSSTAHASTSLRNDGYLTYDLDIPKIVSISAWMKTPNNLNNLARFERYICWAFDSNNRFELIANQSSGGIYVRRAANSIVNVTSTVSPQENEWHHYVLSHDGENIKLFFDGYLAYSVADTNSFSNDPDTLNIGKQYNLSGYGNAYIDDLAIFDRALTADEVRMIYDSNSPIYSSEASLPVSSFITPEGGRAVLMKAGEALVKGNVVHITGVNTVSKIVQDVPDPIGSVYADAASGANVWVVVDGIADIYFTGSTTAGYLARGFISTDVGYVAGQALNEAVPTSPFASDKHFYEIGHVLETRTGAGLAKCVLHFN